MGRGRFCNMAPRVLLLVAAVAAALAVIAHAGDNGLARTPPLGWRSWNLYGGNVNQEKIEKIMDGMVSKKRTVDGVPTSLCDLGYCDVGLDDNWQKCGKYGADGLTYHDEEGNPIINTDTFPNMKDMTDHAHGLGLTAGWYGNNCICSDGKIGDKKFYEGDMKAFRAFGFDSFKLDGCGAQTDMQLWDDVIKASGKAVLVENCHWGSKVPFKPNATWCPWNLYRTSGDVRANYGSVVGNLQTAISYAAQNLSTPGCWAYPDMLEVGCFSTPFSGDKGLTVAETRSHFGAWAIVSSPLTLSHDVNNDTVQDAVWPLISNKEVLAVNQAYFGFSGGAFKASDNIVQLDTVNWAAMTRNMTEEQKLATGPTAVPDAQYLYKPMNAQGSAAAVLLMNHGNTTDLTVKFSDVPGLVCSAAAPCKVRDIWNHKDLGTQASGSFTAKAVGGHDAAFLMVSPA